MNAAVREEPGVEGAWQSGNVVVRQRLPHLLRSKLVEQLQGLEDEVEVVAGEVVEEELDVHGRLALPLAAVGDRAEHLGDDAERVGPRRAAEVGHDHHAREGERRLRFLHGLVKQWPRLQYGLFLQRTCMLPSVVHC